MTNVAQLSANRANATRSTGPQSIEGKAIASHNARQHGLLSSRLLLEDESGDAFDTLMADVFHSLRPVGAIESALAEQICITLWRQRRLVGAETARLSLGRDSSRIAKLAAEHIGKRNSEFSEVELKPVDLAHEKWCKTIAEECDCLDGSFTLPLLETGAKHVYAQLKSDAEDQTSIEAYLEMQEGGLGGYLAELRAWCVEQFQETAQRARLLVVAEQLRAKGLVLTDGTVELFARYQTTLDGQLFEALKAFREAQEWRLLTLDAAVSDVEVEDEATA